MSDVPTPRRRSGDDPGPATPPPPQRAPRTDPTPTAGEAAPAPAHRARNAATSAASTTAAAASLAGKKVLGGAATAAATIADPNATKSDKAQAAVAGSLEVAATAAASAVATPVAGKIAGAVVGAAARSRTAKRAYIAAATGLAVAAVTAIIVWALVLSQIAGSLIDEDQRDNTLPGGDDQCSAQLAPPADAPDDLLTDEQWDNARVIVSVGQERGLPEYGYVVAIATAMQESGLRNIDYGDRDSVGLFQQRPSQGWGTVAQILDPVYSSGKFYDVLVTVTGWEQMPVTVAAQKVQRSGFPDAYAKHETKARQIVSAITGGRTVGGCTGATFECVPLDPNTPERGLTPDALNFARCAAAKFNIPTGNILGVGDRAANPKSDHPNGRAIDLMVPDWRTTSTTGDEWAQFAIDNADAFGVKYVIWNAKVWLPSTGEWQSYSHPSGATDPTNMHLDHVHVSVHGNAGTGYTPDGGGDPGGDVVGGWAFPLNPGARITSPFGPRTHPVTGEIGKMHAGVDLLGATGDPVYAAAAGTVTKVGLWGTGGQTVFVDHGNGLVTHYLHLSQYKTTLGQQVQAGQLIGLVGATGRVTGPHLHFEVEINGSVVDPVQFLKARGVM